MRDNWIGTFSTSKGCSIEELDKCCFLNHTREFFRDQTASLTTYSYDIFINAIETERCVLIILNNIKGHSEAETLSFAA